MSSSAAKKAWETRRAAANEPPKPKLILPKRAPIRLPKEIDKVNPKDMMVRTVVMFLTLSGLGNRRKIDSNAVDVVDTETNKELSKDWVSVNRKLLEAEEFDTIRSIQSKAKAFVMTRALPCVLKDGAYLLPKEFTDPVAERLEQFVAEMQPHVETFAKRLPEYKLVAKREPGFREDQWPTPHTIRDAFRIEWRYLYVDSADGLSKKQAEEERKKTLAAAEEQRQIIREILRAQFCAKVSHLVERLTPETDRRTKSVHESVLGKFSDFLETFSIRDVTDDVQCRALADRAKELLGLTSSTSELAENLRTDTAFRDYVRDGFEAIQEVLEPMIVKKPIRAIRIV